MPDAANNNNNRPQKTFTVRVENSVKKTQLRMLRNFLSASGVMISPQQFQRGVGLIQKGTPDNTLFDFSPNNIQTIAGDYFKLVDAPDLTGVVGLEMVTRHDSGGYGFDDPVNKIIRCTGLLTHIDGFKSDDRTLKTAPLTSVYQENARVRFEDQVLNELMVHHSTRFGTCFLVGPHQIATAKHVIEGRGAELANMRVVFDYEYRSTSDQACTTFSDCQIFCVTRIVDCHLAACGEDWAILELDRDVSNDYLAFGAWPSGDVDPKKGPAVGTVGHPLGMPKTVQITDGHIRFNLRPETFNTDLLGYEGFSGAPVWLSDQAARGIVGLLTTQESLVDGLNTELLANGKKQLIDFQLTDPCGGARCTRTGIIRDRQNLGEFFRALTLSKYA